MIACVAIEHDTRLPHNDRGFDSIARDSKLRVCDGRGRQPLPSDGEEFVLLKATRDMAKRTNGRRKLLFCVKRHAASGRTLREPKLLRA